MVDTKVGTFTQALCDEAKKNGWTVISMKNDWKRISLSSRKNYLTGLPLVTEALREFTGKPNALEPTLPTRATGHGPDTASGLVGVLDLGVEVALGGA